MQLTMGQTSLIASGTKTIPTKRVRGIRVPVEVVAGAETLSKRRCHPRALRGHCFRLSQSPKMIEYFYIPRKSAARDKLRPVFGSATTIPIDPNTDVVASCRRCPNASKRGEIGGETDRNPLAQVSEVGLCLRSRARSSSTYLKSVGASGPPELRNTMKGQILGPILTPHRGVDNLR